MSRNRRRELSSGELAAYALGQELGRSHTNRIERRLRREVHIHEDHVVLIEEEILVEEDNR